MFACWLLNFFENANFYETITAGVNSRGNFAVSIHHFKPHQGMIITGGNNLLSHDFTCSVWKFADMQKYITVSG